MNEIIIKLAYKIGEGIQASSLVNTDDKINAFHRNVITHQSSDISFVNGLVSTGLRGAAILDGEKIISNYNQFLTASRQHLPLVVNTTARLTSGCTYSNINNFGNINAIQQTGCFQFIATSAQEEISFTLIAHRLAELSLIPGIVIADYKEGDDKASIPEDELITKYLGNPDDQIDCPTPAQKMIFGDKRRRIPNWYSLDVPVMLGSNKNAEAISFESAASQKYFYEHLPQLIKQAKQEFKEIFGIEIAAVATKGTSSDHAVISIGGQINELSSGENSKTQILSVKQLSPFPAKAVAELLKGKKTLTILENVAGIASTRSSFYYEILNAFNNTNAKVYSGKFSAIIDDATIDKAIDHMISGQPKMDYYLGIDFTKDSSYPKHDILLKEIAKQYPEIKDQAINSTKTEHSSEVQNEVPLAVRMYRDKGPAYSRLSRFYDNTAFFYENNQQNELVADPFAAVPVVPSLSAGFFSQTSKRELLPKIDVKKCTGKGDNFVNCPHSALLPIVIGVEGLMKTGIDLAASKGVKITKLTPMIKNLAKVAGKIIADADITTVADFLPEAFNKLASQMNLTGEKLEASQNEFNLVLAEIGKLPVAVTNTFFSQPNLQEQGSGELFSLAVNPSSCTGCGICAQVSEAITMEPQNTDNLKEITEQYKLWEQLPDTDANTINRLFHNADYSSLAAMMLSRSYFMTMSGAGNSETDNPYKTLLHIVTATTESVVQPKIVKQINRIDELIGSLSENVHKKLSQSLPKENLEHLSKSLKKAQGEKLSFNEVVSRISEGENSKMLDTKSLGRKTDLVDSLKNLKWALSKGPTGVGRSRYGMLVAGENSMAWAKQYPANNFTNPSVIHWNGSATEQTLGLFHGQLRYLLDNIKLMRRAELDAKDKYDDSTHDIEIAALNWNNLTDDEKKLIPPILLVAERADLNESGWNSLNKLLAQKYPVKVFLFDNITSPDNSPVESLTQTTSGMFSSIALKNAFVLQGGMGNVNHLFDGLMTGLDKTYPALFNLYATKLDKHGISNVDYIPYAALALNSRAFPSVSFNPEDDTFLDGAISLNGNSAITLDWLTENIALSDEEHIDYKITWADWAYTQTDWKSQFTLVNTDDDNISVADYIQLNAKSRNAKTPVIMRSGVSGMKNYAASDKVIEMTEAVLSSWNTLQELAGIVAKIPTKLKEELIQEISDNYNKQITDLKKDYEQQLGKAAASQTEKVKEQLKEKLLALSKMAKN